MPDPLMNDGQVSVFQKDAWTDTGGNHQILYDASNGDPARAVRNRTLQVDPFGLSPAQINAQIMSDARTQTDSPASAHVVLYGGAVAEDVGE